MLYTKLSGTLRQCIKNSLYYLQFLVQLFQFQVTRIPAQKKTCSPQDRSAVVWLLDHVAISAVAIIGPIITILQDTGRHVTMIVLLLKDAVNPESGCQKALHYFALLLPIQEN